MPKSSDLLAFRRGVDDVLEFFGGSKRSLIPVSASGSVGPLAAPNGPSSTASLTTGHHRRR
jgi:hypothetical protein